jgi:5-methylcytosine-specific restriction endonuclease McrA
MKSKTRQIDRNDRDRLVAEARKYQAEREKTYREQALKLYPWICGRCRREFNHGNLRELTVHHRDHNHDNNPPDGSNWELLCVYCHDNEHSRYIEQVRYGSTSTTEREKMPAGTHNPFANLGDMLKGKNNNG